MWTDLNGSTVNAIPEPIKLEVEPTPEIIKALVDNHQKDYLSRYEQLQNYYMGYNNILSREKKDASKPNNRLVSGYPAYIVDMMQGYFVGRPVTYTSKDNNLMQDLQDIFNYNDEQDENSELAKMAGIKGRAYEVVYVVEGDNENLEIRFNEVDADNIIMVYDTQINPEPNFAIRYYKSSSIVDNTETLYAELYTDKEIIKYKQSEEEFVEQSRDDHYFSGVPIIEYLNNDEGIGDFERVMSYIDAYDLTQSDTANDFEEFTDAFLCLVNLSGTDSEDIKKLRDDKVLLMDEKGQAEWLIKTINDTALENYKNRLNQDIHKFAKVPDMSDEKFAGNISGEAMKYKLLALDQVISAKERKFKRALQRRLQLIVNILNTRGKKYDYKDVDVVFTKNRPVNVKEAVETATLLRGFTSHSTALTELPMIDNVTLEIEKIEQEKAAYKDDGGVNLDNIETDNDMMKILELISKLPEKDRDASKDILDSMKSR